jgi:hypothetical protein
MMSRAIFPAMPPKCAAAPNGGDRVPVAIVPLVGPVADMLGSLGVASRLP